MLPDSEKDIKVSKKYQENVDFLKKELGASTSFDVIVREMTVGGKKVALFGLNGLLNGQVLSQIMTALVEAERSDLVPNTFEKIFSGRIAYNQVVEEDTMDKVLYFVLSGTIAMVVDGGEQIIIIDVRSYPGRNPEEPDIERVTRGSRDGFVETLVFNIALIRRRLRDPKLRMELLQVGSRSKADICLAYIEDVANPDLVDVLRQEIKAIKIDGIPMAEKSVEEFILGDKYWNPYPRVRYTERPDVAAIHLLEGHVLVMVDTSPSVMITPATLFHHMQHAEEYRQNPSVGAYIRWLRFFAIFSSVFLVPLWLLVATHPEYLPAGLKFIGLAKAAKIPLGVQILIGEFGIDMMRMAAIHTPTPLATALGLIAAVTIGDMAAKVGLFSPEVIVYIAFAAVATFSTPSYELSMANRMARIGLIVLTWLFGVWGFGLGTLALVLSLGFTKSFNVPYLWPLVPLNWPALKRILVRSPVPIQNMRPSVLKPQDQDRKPEQDSQQPNSNADWQDQGRSSDRRPQQRYGVKRQKREDKG
ncbi:MAG: spore germination protein [Peptococcaceae bacterium]|nr:spore germination protein [Peptococcaceae bacterium]